MKSYARTRLRDSARFNTGFNKAFWTIMDANITTLITALILFEYGTGPIKGFAVTLSIGVVTSVFAALVLTRTDVRPLPRLPSRRES